MQKLDFCKMHGAGNDYIYLNCLDVCPTDPGALSVRLSDRHFGIGGDGLVLILPSDNADYRMRMFNADGSEGKMCGNAIRCVGKYLYDHKLIDKTEVSIETLSGVKHLLLTVSGGKAVSAMVDMGRFFIKPSEIPVLLTGESVVGYPLEICGVTYPVTCVSMGNPHAVTFLPEIDGLDLSRIGPVFEHHLLFPERINTEFIRLIDHENIQMRVWERGSGETLACGTGACAAVVACVLNGHCSADAAVNVHLKGGILEVSCLSNGHVMMKGPAVKVFDGTVETEEDFKANGTN